MAYDYGKLRKEIERNRPPAERSSVDLSSTEEFAVPDYMVEYIPPQEDFFGLDPDKDKGWITNKGIEEFNKEGELGIGGIPDFEAPLMTGDELAESSADSFFNSTEEAFPETDPFFDPFTESPQSGLDDAAEALSVFEVPDQRRETGRPLDVSPEPRVDRSQSPPEPQSPAPTTDAGSEDVKATLGEIMEKLGELDEKVDELKESVEESKEGVWSE